jgi:hypothetical protein
LYLFILSPLAWWTVSAVIDRDPRMAVIMAIMLSPCALPCCYAYARVRRTPGIVTFDNAGVEVKGLMKTWRYPWDEIAGVGWEFVPSRRFPPMKLVQAIKLMKSVEGRSGLVRFVERMTGGAGMLPDLDFDEIETLREAFLLYQARGANKGASTDGAAIMRMLLGRCADLGDIREITKVGTLASIDLVDYETAGSKVRESIQSGDWDVASNTRQGTAGADWVLWYVTERANGQGAVVEIVHYIELYFNEEASLVRTLTPYDLGRCRPYVTDWTSLTVDGVPA